MRVELLRAQCSVGFGGMRVICCCDQVQLQVTEARGAQTWLQCVIVISTLLLKWKILCTKEKESHSTGPASYNKRVASR